MTDPVSASLVSSSSLRKVASDPVLQGKSAVQPLHGNLDSVLNKMAAASAAMKLPPTSSLAPVSSPFVGASNAPIQPLLMSLLTGGAGNGHLASAPSNDSSTSSSNHSSSKNTPNSLYKVRATLCCHPVTDRSDFLDFLVTWSVRPAGSWVTCNRLIRVSPIGKHAVIGTQHRMKAMMAVVRLQ